MASAEDVESKIEDDTEKSRRREWTVEDIVEVLDNADSPAQRAREDDITQALAKSKKDNDGLWAEFKKEHLTDYLEWNEYPQYIKDEAEELAENEQDPATFDDPPPIPEPDEPTYWEDVEDIIVDRYDRQMLDVVEALLANALVLVFENINNAPMLFIEGASGSGKTTAIRMMEPSHEDELLVRMDSLTSASFVSHSTDQDVEGTNDVLPMVKHRLLSVRELSKLFSGDPEKITEFWSELAGVGDGDGNMKATGAQGRRGYRGDYMFAFQGATTPLGPVAWNAMGTIGGRVLFHEALGDYDEAEMREGYWDREGELSERTDECRETVLEFIRTMWHIETDGYASVDWRSHDSWKPEENVQKAIVRFAHLIALTRTPANREDGEWTVGTPESYWRLIDQLTHLCRARALFHGRRQVTIEDISLVARIALSTMPERRRPYVRWLMDPETAPGKDGGVKGEGTARLNEVVEYTGKSRQTVKTHLKLLDRLDLLSFWNDGEPNNERWMVSKHVDGDTLYGLTESERFEHVWDLGVEVPDAYFVERKL